jgi:hypothetical protein
LAEVLGCEPQPLLFMSLLQHELDEAEVEYYEPRIAVAVGLALGQMGGLVGFNFRQEDLVYTRGFDRVKLPLAIACMLGVFAMVVWGMVLRRELSRKEEIYGFAVAKTAGSATRRQKGEGGDVYMQYTGYLGYLVNRTGWPGKRMKHDEYRQMVNKIAEQPTFRRIQTYRNHLTDYLRQVQREGEYDPKLALGSGVAVVEQFSELVRKLEDGLGQFYIGEIDLSLPRGNKQDGGHLNFRVYFSGSDFGERKRILEQALEQAFATKESAFEDFDNPARETTVPGENSAFYQFFVRLKPEIPVLKLSKS